MTHVTCRLTAKNRDQLRNHTLSNRVWATFSFFYLQGSDVCVGDFRGRGSSVREGANVVRSDLTDVASRSTARDWLAGTVESERPTARPHSIGPYSLHIHTHDDCSVDR